MRLLFFLSFNLENERKLCGEGKTVSIFARNLSARDASLRRIRLGFNYKLPRKIEPDDQFIGIHYRGRSQTSSWLWCPEKTFANFINLFSNFLQLCGARSNICPKPLSLVSEWAPRGLGTMWTRKALTMYSINKPHQEPGTSWSFVGLQSRIGQDVFREGQGDNLFHFILPK